MKERKSQGSVNFMSILSEFRKHFLTIIVFGLAGIVTALVFSTFFLTPRYSSTVDLLVNQKSDDTAAQFNLQQADLQAINTYKDVLKKPVILDTVLKNAKHRNNYSGSESDLASSIDIDNQSNSKVISVTVNDKNPYTAADISNDLANVFTKKIKKIMKVNNVTIVSKGNVNTSPVFPNKKINSFLGLLVGIVLGIGFVVIRFLLDTTIKDSEFMTEQFGLPNLGVVYHINKDEESFQVVNVVSSDKTDLPKRRRV